MSKSLFPVVASTRQWPVDSTMGEGIEDRWIQEPICRQRSPQAITRLVAGRYVHVPVLPVGRTTTWATEAEMLDALVADPYIQRENRWIQAESEGRNVEPEDRDGA